MKITSNLFHLSKLITLYATVVLSLITSADLKASAGEEENLTLDIYNIDLDSLNSFDVIEKGASVNLILQNSIGSNKKQNNNSINFEAPLDENHSLKASGLISMSSVGKRFSMSGSIELSTSKFVLDDGQEINLSASSPTLYSIHAPHANDAGIGFARSLTLLSIGSSPLTLGASLGISFLANGILSAHQNGISDFIWGGLNGTGLSLIERVFRKQPDIHLESGAIIPFTLNEDIKISKGIHKEKTETINTSKEEAQDRIQKLLRWGDLTGALEFSSKTKNKEVYDKIIKKISS